MSVKYFLLVTLSLILLAANAGAQNSTDSSTTQSSAQAVTASVSAANLLRVASPEAVLNIKLEIYSTSGTLVFDSGLRQGSIIDWKVADASQQMADGSYLLVTTIRDLHGKYHQKFASLTLQAGQLTLKAQRREELTSVQTGALSSRALSQKIEAVDDDGSLTILRDGKERSLVISAHDGRDGQVTSTSGALTLRTGDVLTGKEKEQMRITPEGNVGIGTDKPQATLDVAGTIRTRGIQFEDGTVLKTAANMGTTTNLATTVTAAGSSSGTALAPMAGTGTANALTKWVDASGTAGDSLLSESGNSILHHGSLFRFTAAANNNIDSNLMLLDDTSKTMGMLAGTTPAFLGTNGPYFALRGNTYSAIANQRGNFAISAGNLSSPAPGEGSIRFLTGADQTRMFIDNAGQIGIGTVTPTQKLEVAGNVRISGAGNGLIFSDGSIMTTAAGGGAMTGNAIVSALNDVSTTTTINDNRLSPNLAKINAANVWSGANVFNLGLSANGAAVSNVANPVSAGDATNKAYVDANFVKFVPGTEQLSVGDANGTATMINLRGGSTCCSGPGGHTPAWFKVFQNGSFVFTGNLGIGTSPMEGKGYRTSWHTYKGAFRSGYADNEWDDANVGFFSWAGGSNSTASGLYALAFGDTNSAESTSSIVFGSGNQVKGAAGFSAGAGNRVCDTYGVALGNNAKSGGPYINGKCDPDTFNLRGLAAVAIGYNVTADQDHTTAMGKFASNNGFQGTFIWSDGSAQASADTFRNTANNEFAARATGGFRFRTNLGGTTGCNLPAGSGVFNCTSSRLTKENFRGVNGEDVLLTLRKVPVTTWNYISEGNSTRHIGPMAEDFYQAFNLGTGSTSIGVQDLGGVGLAAIKALDARTLQLQQKTAEVDQLKSQVSALQAANSSMERRLAALEQNAAKSSTRQHKGRSRR